MLGEHENGAEALGVLPHETRGVEIQLDVGLVAGVEEDGRSRLGETRVEVVER